MKKTDAITRRIEVGSTIYPVGLPSSRDRYVVAFVVGYEHDPEGEEAPRSPEEAAELARELVREGGTVWTVYDRVTGETLVFEDVSEPERAPGALAALRAALPLLIKLGDYIANQNGRCETILQVRSAIDLLTKRCTKCGSKIEAPELAGGEPELCEGCGDSTSEKGGAAAG